MNDECINCQYRSKINTKFCNNYLINIKECYNECNYDNDKEYKESSLYKQKINEAIKLLKSIGLIY